MQKIRTHTQAVVEKPHSNHKYKIENSLIKHILCDPFVLPKQLALVLSYCNTLVVTFHMKIIFKISKDKKNPLIF